MIYEYGCDICGKELEVVQKLNDPEPICDHENSDFFNKEKPTKMKKMISKTSFALKGDGWYSSGYTKGTKK